MANYSCELIVELYSLKNSDKKKSEQILRNLGDLAFYQRQSTMKLGYVLYVGFYITNE